MPPSTHTVNIRQISKQINGLSQTVCFEARYPINDQCFKFCKNSSDGFIDNPADAASLLFQLFIASHLSGPHFPRFHPPPMAIVPHPAIWQGEETLYPMTSQIWKHEDYFWLGSGSVPGISMPASVLKLIYFSICAIHESTHLTSQERKWLDGLHSDRRPWAEASFQGNAQSISTRTDLWDITCVFHTHRTHAADRWWGRGRQELSSFYSETEWWLWQVCSHFTLFGSPQLALLFCLGGKTAHIIWPLVQV